MVTTATDSKGVTGLPVTAHSAGLKVLRFESDAWIALILGNSTNLQCLRGLFREEYSKRSS